MDKRPKRKRAGAARPLRESPKATPAAAPSPESATPAIVVPESSSALLGKPELPVDAGERPRYPSGEGMKLGLSHDDDKFLVGNWQDKTKKKFARLAANTPELAHLVGGSSSGPAVDPLADIPNEAIGAIFGAVGQVGRWLLARAGTFSAEQLRACGYTEQQIKDFTPLAKRVIVKHLPDGASEYTDEIALAMALLYTLQSNIAAAATKPPAAARPPAEIVHMPNTQQQQQA